MTPTTDQRLAQWLLDTRTNGCTGPYLLRRNLKWYALLFAVFIPIIALLALVQRDAELTWLLVGMLAGCLLRDVGWFARVVRAWPFNVKVLD